MEIGEQLQNLEISDKAKAEVLNAMVQSEVLKVEKELTRLNEVGLSMTGQINQWMSSGPAPNNFSIDGQGGGSGGGRAPTLRLGLKPLLEYPRNAKVESAEHFYSLRDSKLPHGRLPPWWSDAGWAFELISNKVFMVLLTYFGQDPTEVVLSLSQNCGLEAYGLISVECDLITADSEFGLLERDIMVGKFECKNVIEAHVALREAKLSWTELGRRVPKSEMATAETRQMITGMLYANILGPATKKRVLGKEGARDNFDSLRMAVEEFFEQHDPTHEQ